MINKQYFKFRIVLFLALAGIFVLASCKPKTTTDPKSVVNTPTATQNLSKTWSVSVAKEGGATVYTNGGSSNIKESYASFKLDLRNQSSAKMTEIDGRTFTGTWSLSANEKTLTLANLNPVPTSTGGSIYFTIAELTASSLKITRSTENRKTGATSTEYTLTNP